MTNISNNLARLIALILVFIALIILVWVCYDLNIQRLNKEEQRLKQSGSLSDSKQFHNYSNIVPYDL